jgi:hypothetical protein
MPGGGRPHAGVRPGLLLVRGVVAPLPQPTAERGRQPSVARPLQSGTATPRSKVIVKTES